MATVVNNPSTGSDTGNGMGMVIGLIVLVLVVFLIFFFGVPMLRNGGALASGGQGGNSSVTLPEDVNVNVNPVQ